MNSSGKGVIQLIVVVAFIFGSFMVSQFLSYTKEPPKTHKGGQRSLFVETQQMTPGTHYIAFNTTGTVQARGTVNAVPQVSGRITRVNDAFYEGGQFRSNELLFQIDKRDFVNEVNRLEAQVASAQTALELAKAESGAALAEWELLNKGQKAPPLVAREPQLKEAEAALKAAKAQLQNARLQLERTRYALPFNGKVISSDLAEGQYVVAGQSYGTVFDVNSLEVRASLQDNQLEWLLKADNPNIALTSRYLGQTREYAGVFKRGGASLDAQTRFASVAFGFANGAPDLVPGVFVDITVKGSSLSSVLSIPPSALQKEGIVWFVDADNKLIRHEPEILYASKEEILIRGTGEPVNVVTSRLAGGAQGMQVQQQEEDEEETP